MANFEIGATLTVKTCEQGTENFGWGFRVGEKVVVINPADIHEKEVPGMRAVESIARGLFGYFPADHLSA